MPKKNLNIALRVTEEEKKFVEQVADTYGFSTSQILKRALSFYLWGINENKIPSKLEVKIDG